MWGRPDLSRIGVIRVGYIFRGVAVAVWGRESRGRLREHHRSLVIVNRFLVLLGKEFVDLPRAFVHMKNRLRYLPFRFFSVVNFIPKRFASKLFLPVPWKLVIHLIIVRGAARELMRSDAVVWGIERNSKSIVP